MQKNDDIVREVAANSGVGTGDVLRVLDSLGFSQTLESVRESVGEEPLRQVSADGLRVSLRVGSTTVAV